MNTTSSTSQDFLVRKLAICLCFAASQFVGYQSKDIASSNIRRDQISNLIVGIGVIEEELSAHEMSDTPQYFMNSTKE